MVRLEIHDFVLSRCFPVSGGEFKSRDVKMLAISCDPLDSHQVRYMLLLLGVLRFYLLPLEIRVCHKADSQSCLMYNMVGVDTYGDEDDDDVFVYAVPAIFQHIRVVASLPRARRRVDREIIGAENVRRMYSLWA